MTHKNTSSKKTPLVSFLLPIYNCEDFLVETLHSIIEQTYTNFEVIAIDDGSKDGSLKILKKYAEIDPRIKVFSRENKGLVATLNQAIEIASGELLARIDADDVCVPKRLEWQVEEMQRDKKAALCYGFFEIFNESGEFKAKSIRPTHQEDMKRLFYTRNAIAHASVMLRKSLLPKNPYKDDVGPTEDYELWSRLAVSNDLVCSPHVIMRYRENTSGIMHTIGHTQWIHMERNIGNYWKAMGPPKVLSPREIRKRMSSYMHENAKTMYGPEILQFMLDGESQLAMKCLRRGYLLSGLKIMFFTAISSRTGFRACKRRVTAVLGNGFKKLFSSPLTANPKTSSASSHHPSQP